jgi:hypothetical protein
MDIITMIPSILLALAVITAVAVLPWREKEAAEVADAWRALGSLIRRWLC